MSTTNDPAKSSGPAATSAAASPKPKTPAAQAMVKRLYRLDVALLALVLLLAFFLGSFTASDSDLFLHLSFANPFAASATWPNHAWLPSLLVGLIYEPYSATAEVGGGIAVALKALVVVAIAVVLLLIRHKGQSLVLPIVYAALAVLVMSPWLLLQPFVLSLLLLAVTLFVLTRPATAPPRTLWCLPPLFALWVNVDHWFVLGPIMVALCLLGEWLQGYLGIPAPADRPRRPQRIKQLAIVLLAGMLACLVNPWLFRAWTLPPDLAYLSVSTLDLLPGGITAPGKTLYKAHQQDPQFNVLTSPLSSDFWSRPSAGLNTAGLAYFVLLLIGAASFYLATLRPTTTKTPLPRPGLSMPLAVVFVFFALLSVAMQRLIPLFAVVAGPIAALNLQECARRLLPANAPLTPKQKNWTFAGRGLALVACLLLLVCAWPGWLHANPDNWRLSHRVRWQVLEDPGVLKAAQTIAWIQEKPAGLMQRGFCYDPEAGNLLAWPAHLEKKALRLLCDGRYGLYTKDADVYGKIRKSLRDEIENRFPTAQAEPTEERKRNEKIGKAIQAYTDLLRQLGIDYVVFSGCHHNPATKRMVDGMLALIQQWTLLYHDGRTAIFGWRDPGALKGNDSPFDALKLDVTHLVAQNPPTNMPQVSFDPQRVPPVPTEPLSSWDQFIKGFPGPSLAGFESEQLHVLFELEMRNQQPRYFVTWLATVGGPMTFALDLHHGGPEYEDEQKRKYRKIILRPQDLGPPAAPLLSARAARNAVLESPFFAPSYLQLASATHLLRAQEDHWAKTPVLTSLRLQCRQVTLVTALNTTVTLQPNNAIAQKALSDLYRELRYSDLALEHLLKFRESIDEQRLPQQERDNLEENFKQLSDYVKRQREDYKRNVGSQMDAVDKFQLSLYGEAPSGKQGPLPGLAKQGLKLLQDARADKLTPERQKELVYLQIQMLLTTGQAREAQERLKPDLRDKLAASVYEQLQALAAVALGDYAAADQYLAEAENRAEKPPTQEIVALQKDLAQEAALQQAGQVALAPLNALLLLPLPPYRSAFSDIVRIQGAGKLSKLAGVAIRVGEIRLLRGLLALEVGNTAAAAEHFRAVLAVVPGGLYFPDGVIAQRYLELLK
jgi:hypothetical protein